MGNNDFAMHEELEAENKAKDERIEELVKVIEDHNSGCDECCKWMKENRHCYMTDSRTGKCHDCPTDWRIDLASQEKGECLNQLHGE